jgi:hypothetical protein
MSKMSRNGRAKAQLRRRASLLQRVINQDEGLNIQAQQLKALHADYSRVRVALFMLLQQSGHTSPETALTISKGVFDTVVKNVQDLGYAVLPPAEGEAELVGFRIHLTEREAQGPEQKPVSSKGGMTITRLPPEEDDQPEEPTAQDLQEPPVVE